MSMGEYYIEAGLRSVFDNQHRNKSLFVWKINGWLITVCINLWQIIDYSKRMDWTWMQTVEGKSK